MVNALGPVLGYTSVELTDGEQGEMVCLQTLRNTETAYGIDWPDKKGTSIPNQVTPKYKIEKRTKSTSRRLRRSVSAVLIYKGMKHADGTPVEVEMVDSKLHVFTRLRGREESNWWKSISKALQMKTFKEMEQAMIHP